MIEIDWANLDRAYAEQPSSITVGVFDGLHTGHRGLIEQVTSSEWMPVVVTFQRHPTELLLHDDIPGFIMSLSQKRHALMDLGVAVTVLIDFDEAFRSLPGEQFLNRLGEAFLIRRFVVGHDFRCGFQLDTDIKAIRRFLAGRDVEVVALDPIRSQRDLVSSSRIRDLIVSGDLLQAARLLGRAYTLDVTEEEIDHDGDRAYIVKNGRGLLPESRQLLPPAGRYRAVVGSDGTEREVELDIGANSLNWPLVAGETIRYIVLQTTVN